MRRWTLLALSSVTAAFPARAQTAPPAPEVSINAANVQTSAAAEAALERVLRSGCRDGLAEVRSLIGDPRAPWAETVARLCGDVFRLPPAAVTSAPGEREAASANEGRGRLVFWSSLYGIWLGIASDELLDINGVRSAIIPPMVGMGATLSISLLATAGHPLTTGQAWTIITGLDYATYNGALWGAGLGLSAKGAIGTAIATSAVATGIATWVAVNDSPKAGDIELVRSSLLWGSATGLLAIASFAPSSISGEAVARGGALAMDLGLVAGIGLADHFDLSRNRVLIIDAGAVGGGLTGFGVAWLIVGGPNASGHAVAGGALAGLLSGLAVAAIATRHLDTGDTRAGAPAYPALFARGADGRWSVGLPGPTPVLGGTGTRTVGASLAVVGGVL